VLDEDVHLLADALVYLSLRAAITVRILHDLSKSEPDALVVSLVLTVWPHVLSLSNTAVWVHVSVLFVEYVRDGSLHTQVHTLQSRRECHSINDQHPDRR
jgi:uncharacterized membrane protein YhaH (DUF805 family)